MRLSSELTDSLWTLKPEGNVLGYRFKSFQRRNRIEPRERAKFKCKYKVQLVEKRVFRDPVTDTPFSFPVPSTGSPGPSQTRL